MKSRAPKIQDAPMDPPGYADRVAELEAEGLTTSDAQGVADAELRFGRSINPPTEGAAS